VRKDRRAVSLIVSALVNGFIIVAAMLLRIAAGNVLPWTWPDLIFTLLSLVAVVVVLYAATRFVRDVLRWWAGRSDTPV
jgi:hypothetical protein